MKQRIQNTLLIGLVLLHWGCWKTLDAAELFPFKNNTPSSQATASIQPFQAHATQMLVSQNMKKRSLETHGVMKIPEPKFIREGSSARDQGVYFGVGFRQVGLYFHEGRSIVNGDSAANGAAFNLGYFTETQMIEYTHHVTLLRLETTLPFENQNFNFIEMSQNNWWYFQNYRLMPDWYVHYGLGVQIAEVRLIVKTDEEPAPNTDEVSALQRENFILIGVGSSYFFTPNFFVQYRFAYGDYSSALSGPQTNNVLNSTQIHILFLQYYFAL